MNWNSHEFVWLDWAVLVIGVILVAWMVYRSVRKDKLAMKGADSQDYLFGKGEPWYVIGRCHFCCKHRFGAFGRSGRYWS